MPLKSNIEYCNKHLYTIIPRPTTGCNISKLHNNIDKFTTRHVLHIRFSIIESVKLSQMRPTHQIQKVCRWNWKLFASETKCHFSVGMLICYINCSCQADLAASLGQLSCTHLPFSAVMWVDICQRQHRLLRCYSNLWSIYFLVY